MAKRNKRVVLAYSGGLDTTYCALYLAHELGWNVTTVTVNTGGHTAAELAQIARSARSLGAAKHVTIDARKSLYDRFIAYGIKGNLTRGGHYPLCVGIERTQQAIDVAQVARKIRAHAVAHGSTAAGNDQIRFDAVFLALLPSMPILAPIREMGLSRDASSTYLRKHGFPVPRKTSRYSVNQGLWGTTIGGGETHDPARPIPDSAYVQTRNVVDAPERAQRVRIAFANGLPTHLNGRKQSGVQIVESLAKAGARHGVGRGVHTGDTILGIKGRVAFEAPAATILLAAHQELEKITLSKAQGMQKRTLCELYSDMLHTARYFEPVMRDIEAFIDSTQQTVTGTVTVSLHKGNATVESVDSPFSHFKATGSAYGETADSWTGADAASFARIYSMPANIARKAGERQR